MSAMAASAAPAKIKGPIVWLDMDQQELDDAYDQHVYAPNRDQVVARRIAASEQARAFSRRAAACRLWQKRIRTARHLSAPLPSLPRGEGGKRRGAPVNVFVH